MINRVAAATLLILSLPGAWVSASHSCTCRPSSDRAKLAASDVAFIGVVVAVQQRETVSDARFLVRHVYKGDVPQTAVVRTHLGTIAHDGCAVDFVAGQDYVVFARADAAAATTDVCTTSNDPGRFAASGAARPIRSYPQTVVADEGSSPEGAPVAERSRTGLVAAAAILASAVAAGTWAARRPARRGLIPPD